MSKENLVFQTSPGVSFATNIFTNVPVILKYDDTNLIEIVHEVELGYTTKIPIYNSDGVMIAKTSGTRVYDTNEGVKSGVKMYKEDFLTVCKMEGKTLFEVRQQEGELFRISAELYTPTGYFVKSTDDFPLALGNSQEEGLLVNGIYMSGNKFNGGSVGIWVRSDGSVSIGVA